MRLRRGRCRNLNLPIKDWQANKAICIRVEMEERDAQRHDMPQHSCQIFRDAPGPAVWFIRIDDPHETASIRRCEYRYRIREKGTGLPSPGRGRKPRWEWPAIAGGSMRQ